MGLRNGLAHRRASAHPVAVGPVAGGPQEVIQVLGDDPVEHARFRVAGLVASPSKRSMPRRRLMAERANAQRTIQRRKARTALAERK